MVRNAVSGQHLHCGEAGPDDTEQLLDTQNKIRDADSGKDFGRDLSMDKTPPELLARKVIALKRINTIRPLEPVEVNYPAQKDEACEG